MAGGQIVGRLSRRGPEPLLGIPGRLRRRPLELVVILGHDGLRREEDLSRAVPPGIFAVDLLAGLQDSVGFRRIALPEQGPRQALVGDQILGREFQQVAEAGLGLLIVLTSFRRSRNGTHFLLFQSPLALGGREVLAAGLGNAQGKEYDENGKEP